MADEQTPPPGLRERYRVAHTLNSFAVLDLGEPDEAGYWHDDGHAPIVYEPTGGLTAEAKAKARNRAVELNEQDAEARRG